MAPPEIQSSLCVRRSFSALSRKAGVSSGTGAPVTLEKALRSRFYCDPNEIEYWEEMIRLTAERESVTVQKIQIRTNWETDQWAEAWAVTVSEYLAVNRADGCWIITHILTGLAAGSASNLKDAIRTAREVAPWPEWAVLRTKDDISP